MTPDVVVLSFDDPRKVSGGVQRRVAAEISAYVSAGLSVRVLTRHLDGIGPSLDPRVQIDTWVGHTAPYPLQTVRFAVWAQKRLRQLPRSVVVAHHDHGLAPILAGRAFIEVVHGVFLDEARAEFHRTGASGRSVLHLGGLLPLAMIECAAVHAASHVITVSEYIRTILPRQYGRLKRVMTVPNGVDYQRYQAARPAMSAPPMGVTRLGMVGRLHPRKGPLILADALARLSDRDLAIEVVVVGDGPQRASMERRLASAGPSVTSRFLGYVSDQRSSKHLRVPGRTDSA